MEPWEHARCAWKMRRASGAAFRAGERGSLGGNNGSRRAERACMHAFSGAPEALLVGCGVRSVQQLSAGVLQQINVRAAVGLYQGRFPLAACRRWPHVSPQISLGACDLGREEVYIGHA